MEEETKIVVPQSSVARQTFALIRYAMTAIGAYVLGRGYVEQDTMLLIGVIGGTVLPGAYGIYETYRDNAQKKAMAAVLPDHIAEIKK